MHDSSKILIYRYSSKVNYFNNDIANMKVILSMHGLV